MKKISYHTEIIYKSTEDHNYIFNIRIEKTNDDMLDLRMTIMDYLDSSEFKRWLERLYSMDILDLDYKSCEMISDDLYNEIIKKYPGRKVSIEISEDGENGSYIEYGINENDTKVQTFEDKTVEGVRRVFYIDSDISDEEAKNIIDQFKTKNIPKVTPEESPESQPVSDEHFENTFNQAMKKLDEVVTPVQKEVLTKTSKWMSIKNHIQTLFGI